MAWLERFKARKLAAQATALLLTVLAALPITVGLNSGVDALAAGGLVLAGLGMALALWVS